MPRITFDAAACQKCGRCVDICPEGIILQASPRAVPRVRRARACISCGHCVSICPQGAVGHSDFEEFKGKEGKEEY